MKYFVSCKVKKVNLFLLGHCDLFHSLSKLFVIQQELKDPNTAVVKMIDSGAKIKMDQIHVETVIPAIGKYIPNSMNLVSMK